MPKFKTMSAVEALAAFLVENGIQYAFGIGGHGNTPLLEAFLPYHKKNKLRVVDVQHEAVAAHAATALKWMHGIDSVVFTSIGPGWFNTLIGQSTAMSHGYGYLVLAGDKTTAYEGPNMQQIMRDGQFGFVHAANAVAKQGYTIIDPRNLYSVLPEALAKTQEPASAGPVNVFLPMNLQSQIHEYNTEMLLRPLQQHTASVRPDTAQVAEAVVEIRKHRKIAIRVGGGAVAAGEAIKSLAKKIGATVIIGPVAMDAVESDFPPNVGPAGSKGSIAGNYAAEHATLVINVGGRGVCQSDSSGTLYRRAKAFININFNAVEAQRYQGIAVVGDARATAEEILIELRKGARIEPDEKWQAALGWAKRRWETYLQSFFDHPVINGKLTQPAAVKAIDDYVIGMGGIKIFDAGDVQAHGFQICRHEQPKTYLNETGNSCMGFGICAAFGLGLVPGGRYPTSIIGDGSFLMQAQAIRDMVKHRSNCTIVVLDNQAMGAITALQWAQKYEGFATVDIIRTQPVDYAILSRSMGCQAYTPGASTDSLSEALDQAFRHQGPAVIDVKVHLGPEEYAALGAFGRWNVGPWSEQVEKIWEGKAKPE